MATKTRVYQGPSDLLKVGDKWVQVGPDGVKVSLNDDQVAIMRSHGHKFADTEAAEEEAAKLAPHEANDDPKAFAKSVELTAPPESADVGAGTGVTTSGSAKPAGTTG